MPTPELPGLTVAGRAEFERFLREEVAPSIDAHALDPSQAIPAGQVMPLLRELHRLRLMRKP